MQPINQVNTNSEVIRKESDNSWIYKLPTELSTVLPENIWSTLSLDQKKQILRDYGLYERYVSSQEVVEADIVPTVSQPTTETIVEKQSETPEIIDANASNNLVDREVFTSQLEQIKLSEQELENQKLSKEEQGRIDAERATQANTASSVGKTVKVFGYQIPMPTINNAKSIADNNPTSSSDTWAAVLAKKILAIFD